MTTAEADVPALMDRIYRPQRRIYDLTRKYYLLGRDQLLDGMAVLPGETVLEIGCGTGRNLVRMARLYPQARLIGMEPSSAMLATARASLARHHVDARLLPGTAENLCTADLGRRGAADHIVFSYVLSMIADPAAAIDRALPLLGRGGTLHVVDFGDFSGLPGLVARLLRNWLRCFHVHPRPAAAQRLDDLALARHGTLVAAGLLGGYAELLRFRVA